MSEKSFQTRVGYWMLACFGAEISRNKTERNHRFLEEALELVQAGGCTASEAHQLVDYVFGRPVGELSQEVGGVMVTLSALCDAFGTNLDASAEAELRRIWTKVEQIRAKQAAKPKHSPLPTAELSPCAGSEFGFQFSHGFKWANDMTREELMHVIAHLRHEKTRQSDEMREHL